MNRAFRLYLITDRNLAAGGLNDTIEKALAAACQVESAAVAVQIREKDLPGAELFQLAETLKKIADKYSAPVLINDRIDIALAADLDGVHLPGGSFSVSEARKLLGREKLIGVSNHSAADVHRASSEGADFVVFGPVYEPISKKGYGPPAGVDRLKEAVAAADIPVYAIGGITPERAAELRDSGAAGVAVIGAVMGARDPASAVEEMLDALRTWSAG